MPSTRLIGIGLFVVIGFLLFAVGLFLIGDRRLLFTERFIVNADFGSIAGLQNGAKVRVAGMDAGEVLEIHVPTGPAGQFRVMVRVREDLRPLVRTDSVASIQTDGLVGNKFVQIEAGSEKAAIVEDGGLIRSREPFDVTDVLDQITGTIENINDTIDQVRADLDTTMATLNDTAKLATGFVDVLGKDVKAITEAGVKVAADAQQIVEGVRAGRGALGRFVNDDELYRETVAIAQEAERTIRAMREAAEQAKQVVDSLGADVGPARDLVQKLEETVIYAREAMASLAENSEALKRNWFFRGFFNRRGYFNLDDLSVQEYRAGALETSERAVLRLWLDAGVLFGNDASGAEQLTSDGRARLDSAMSQYVIYPRTSPLVVEGYATEATNDRQYLVSRYRAQIVREYVLEKFKLDTNYVGAMAMGAEAPGSPAGNAWQGVALALFVEKAHIR